MTVELAPPKYFLVSGPQVNLLRELFRALGPAHRQVDRWRHDLGWKVDEDVVDGFLKGDR